MSSFYGSSAPKGGARRIYEPSEADPLHLVSKPQLYLVPVRSLSKPQEVRKAKPPSPLLQKGIVTLDRHTQPLISRVANWVYWLGVHTLLTYSITLILLVILQTNTIHLTLQGLIALVTVHNYLSIGVIGMNSKISSLVRSDTVRRGISARSVREHVRDDRRMMCLVLHAVLSFVIVVDIWWIGSLVDDRQVEASSFRSTGINLFVHRALDLQYTLIMTLAVPIALFIANELHFKFNNNRMQVEQERRRRAKAQGSEEDEESKGNGARDSDISEDNEEDEENEDDFDTDEDEHDEDQ